nr:cation-transporting P-type ATPase [Candidatus Enterousia merdequi]
MQITGLTSKQVIANRKKYGENIIPSVPLKTVWDFFKEICFDKLNLILLILLSLLTFIAFIGYGSWTEPAGIAIVLFVVYTVGIFTKTKAQKSTNELLNKSAIRYCKVIRDNKIKRINTTEIVISDIIILQSGETIPADGYIIDGKISVNNSVLNGESEEVIKKPIANYKYKQKNNFSNDDYVSTNLLFSGTSVQSGEGYMLVTSIGKNTENAKTLLAMRQVKEVKTDLDIKLEHFASQVSMIGYIFALAFFIIMMLIHIVKTGGIHNFFNLPLWDIIHTAILNITIGLTVVVSIVPEGLPLIINIIVAQNAKKMLKHNILVKNTHKIAEAGNIQILCTDKTGTLTYGKLIPMTCYLGNTTQIGFDSDTELGQMIAANLVLNSEAVYDDKAMAIGGTSTQRALLEIIKPFSKMYKTVTSKNTVINKLVFNSANKFSMSNIKSKTHNKIFAHYTGAPEIILEHTNRYMDIDGKKHTINHSKIRKLLSQNARQAKRLIALAYCETKNTNEKIQDNLILLGLIAIRDDVRQEVPAAVKRVQTAGIQTIMITGDNLETATSIAKDATIINSDQDIAILASDLEQMSDKKIIEILPQIRVIARATPFTKLRVVQVAQKMGLCIGMCGDGTNDAPALRQADVGFAMGSGTDVCKEASDIIIIDDNYVSVVDSILFGRTFIENVNKFLMFQFPINIAMMFICLVCPIFYNSIALTAVQILMINIVTDSLNALAFGGEPTKPEYMLRQPAKKGAPLINKTIFDKTVLDVIVFFLMMMIFANLLVKNQLVLSESQAISARFAVLSIVAIINGFNIRENTINIFKGLSKNLLFIGIAIIVTTWTVLSVQFGGDYFGTSPLNIKQWGIIVALAFLIIPLDMIRKMLIKHKIIF